MQWKCTNSEIFYQNKDYVAYTFITLNCRDLAEGKQPFREPTRIPDLRTKMSWVRKRREKYRAEIQKSFFEGWKFHARVAREKVHG